MREAAFVRQNKDKWLRFENVLLGNTNELTPDELSALYLEVTDHLSYARTFYPESKTTQYLNYLASRSHHALEETLRVTQSKLNEFR